MTPQQKAPDATGKRAEFAAAPAEARRAGRGAVLITSAKALFILSAWAVHAALPRLLQSDGEYGRFAVGFGAIAMLNNVLIASTVQSVSKMVSAERASPGRVLRQGLLIQATLGGGLSLLLFGVAPLIARYAYVDPTVSGLLRIGAAVALAYSVYAAVVGYLNGERLFHRQAGLDAVFSVLRTGGILTAAAVGASAGSALSGFAFASLTIVIIALLLSGFGERGPGVPLRDWLRFMVPVWTFQAFLSVLMQLDLHLLKGSLTQLALEQGELAQAAQDLANRQAAYYRSAQMFAFVPYQLVLSITFILFPYVSRATSLGDASATRDSIRRGFRGAVLVLFAVASPVAAGGADVIHVVYPEAYRVAGDALTCLAFGMVGFSLFVLGATVLGGAGRPSLAALLAGGGVLILLVVCPAAIRMSGLGPEALFATAASTCAANVAALGSIAFVLVRLFGNCLPWTSALRAGVAAALAFAVVRAIPSSGSTLLTLCALGSGSLVYGLSLVALREVQRADVQALKAVLGYARR